MQHTEQWIWLPREQYPDAQETVYSGFYHTEAKNYTVAEFTRTYSFPKMIAFADLRYSGDTAFRLLCNGALVATGPACVGGVFMGNEAPREPFYAFESRIRPEGNTLSFFARVKMLPFQICEYSKGHGGFMLSAIVTFTDGTQQAVFTDESWQVRKNGAYAGLCFYDGRIQPDPFVPAQRIENRWHTLTAPIPVRQEYALSPDNSEIRLAAGEEKTVVLELDKIWAGFVRIEAKTRGEVSVRLLCRELAEAPPYDERVIFVEDGVCQGFCMHSAGSIRAELVNRSDSDARIRVTFLATHYPVGEEGETVTSDPELNQVLRTCKHTLKVCRQTHHLDSPRHCEPLACTGDYYIETLMTAFSFGDMRLAAFDLIRTADMLEKGDGRIFHTTYSLIWVKMLRDVYMMTGDERLLSQCEGALGCLLRRFETYLGANGLIETPPDYMFVDWIYIDGHSMHHPPKALGQTCLNLFYFGALEAAEHIYRCLSEPAQALRCGEKREALRQAINRELYDGQKQMYFEGLNTPTPEQLLGEWMPANTDKRYYLKHSNILAACFGVCDDECAKSLIRRILSDEIGGDCQPYFLHYLLEAVFRLDLRDAYTLQILERWKAPVQVCTKGLVEGFVTPEPGYSFDHSHAWGGTPLYSLPKALLGLQITEPGMRELSLAPSLLGLTSAKTELLTPYGKLICRQEQGKAPIITCPKEIRVTLR